MAFLSDKVLLNSGENLNDYMLLCPKNYNGEETWLDTKSVSRDNIEECAWGVSPGNALVVSSAMEMRERIALQIFLRKASKIYGERPFFGANSVANSTETTQFGIVPENEYNDYYSDEEEEEKEEKFRLFESAPRYGMIRNLLFSDAARGFLETKPEEMSYKPFLQKLYGTNQADSYDQHYAPITAIEGVRR